MELFEEISLGPVCPISCQWWKKYVDDVISIVKKTQVETLFENCHNGLDPHIKLTVESFGIYGSISFLDKYLLNEDHSILTLVYRVVSSFSYCDQV